MSAQDNWRARARCPYFGTKTKERVRCQDPLSETEGETVLETTDEPVLEAIFTRVCCDQYERCPIYLAMTMLGGYEDVLPEK